MLEKTAESGRRGRLSTAHGIIETPFFMPVGTAGAMKGITHDELLSLGAQILLCNTYHLHLQPGEDIVEEAGGLHQFIGWQKPILTDSGGYQVYSFGKNGRTKVTEDGVQFQSHLNGDTH
ncbi:MAG: tRNA guanosine(34) transglycosylase Tgt, partial [Candidatus Peribacteraceae bacterium]